MSGEHPSEKQLRASQAQSEADRSGQGKTKASELQSEADSAAVRKHGL
ncbi:hypothetical protein FHS18_004776 [Paenibacillus phyllosphaerae]|uniref:Uncharacterized protein n=1 Tax=Paenibacillus phyllosphaerae TaxID=274593 RepID=A0A7W5FPR9_9BACL|nr:hypothetical protein [Paenibacillus phyllosphaerae]MBB3112675.1 hypothetical protein [Paenibacillus phyllosphaerae]